MSKLDGKTIAILATNGFEQSELFVPLEKLREAGATVHVVSLQGGEIKGWDKDDWGKSVPIDREIDEVQVSDYDALVLPGGQINPDLLRVEKKAVDLVRHFFEAKKPLAAICHAPWLLIEAGIVKGRNVTSYHSIETDVRNAGGLWSDEAVVVDNGLITSRNPGDLDAFVSKITEEVLEGRHEDRDAA